MNPTEEHLWTKPKFLEEWNVSPTKSMKLDVLAKLLKYHLESDGRQPLMMDESGRNLVPNVAFTAGNTHSDDPDRIVVFSAFVTSNQAIVDVSYTVDNSGLLIEFLFSGFGPSRRSCTRT